MPIRPRPSRLLAIAFAGLCLAPCAHAIDITVDVLGDPAPDGCTPGSCSLREAIALANGLAGPDRILLPATPGVPLQLSRSGTDDSNVGGDLDILDALEIVGPGADATRVVQTVPQRVFDIHLAADGFVRLAGFRIEGGDDAMGGAVRTTSRLALEDMAFHGNKADAPFGTEHGSEGGAVWLEARDTASPVAGPRLSIIASHFEDNTAGNGVAGEGGAVHMYTRIATGALLAVSDSDFIGNVSGNGGGAIAIGDEFDTDGGSISVRDSRFTDNRTHEDGEGNGGALRIDANAAQLTISRTEFSGNIAQVDGGAVWSNASTTAVTASRFTDGEAEGGGALMMQGGRIVDSTLCDNQARLTGGAVSARGPLEIQGSTLCRNVAWDDSARGGAVSFSAGTQILRIERSTLSDNRAPRGGAIRVTAGRLDLRSSTIVPPSIGFVGDVGLVLDYADSSANARAQFRNSLLLGSCAYAVVPMRVALHNAHTGTDTCRLGDAQTQAGNLIGITTAQANLGPLADNGGPTFTRLPQAPSVAIDAGDASSCPETDQRGYPIDADACDIGAVDIGAQPEGELFADGFE